MSIIFGIRKPQGASVSDQELLDLARGTGRYALDGVAVSVSGRVGMGFQPFYTHLRSKLELAPIRDAYGNLLVFDGRIDNYVDLCQELRLHVSSSADSQVILAAFLHWGKDCFSKLIGDWALALWSAKDEALYLARDHAGTRTLYFENKNGTILWSTYLDSFFIDSRNIDVDEDYAACYLAALPIRDLTPYKGIRAVLPAHYVVARRDTLSTVSHWQWLSNARIRYGSDRAYEEHFLALLGQAVERRDGPGAPILAQLSGGMDSTSIVCLSDHLRRRRNASADLLDTISFYDDSEPSWNEKPYFSAVEDQRRKAGTHIEMPFMGNLSEPHHPIEGHHCLPGADSSAIERERKIQAAIGDKGYRSVLSGIGGDEILGGVPACKPELADYLVAGEFVLLLRRTVQWCLVDRTPFLHMLFDTLRYAFDLYRAPRVDKKSIPPWIQPSLRRACDALAEERFGFGGDLESTPSSIANGCAWWSIMETLPHLYPGFHARPEYRYPLLDKELVDYLFSIPRDQLVRPGRRRCLMRRALKDIVPKEILERRRKGYRIRGPLITLQQNRSRIDSLLGGSQISRRGFIDSAQLRIALDVTTRCKDTRWFRCINRAIALEVWLRENAEGHRFAETKSQTNQILLPNIGANKIRALS